MVQKGVIFSHVKQSNMQFRVDNTIGLGVNYEIMSYSYTLVISYVCLLMENGAVSLRL